MEDAHTQIQGFNIAKGDVINMKEEPIAIRKLDEKGRLTIPKELRHFDRYMISKLGEKIIIEGFE